MIIDEIAAQRRKQLARQKSAVSFEELKKVASRAASPKGFKAALLKGRLSVIAEIKKASPSKGIICADFHPVEIAKTYEAAGADALSVLTEEYYFKGSSDYLQEIRQAVSVPILRKDFIIDPYLIYEARVIGADAILLIAALLEVDALREYVKIAGSLGLACLTEAHNEEELYRAVEAGSEIIGINNRDLKTFNVDLNTTARFAKLVPQGRAIVSESGIATSDDMRVLKASGVNAVLIGETLMRSADIPETMRELRAGL
jgi:indole-3-glycerol phosphate synthase